MSKDENQKNLAYAFEGESDSSEDDEPVPGELILGSRLIRPKYHILIAWSTSSMTRSTNRINFHDCYTRFLINYVSFNTNVNFGWRLHDVH